MDSNNIQWFPGHMTRAKRKIKDILKLLDIAVEVVDARVPMSSRNPEFKDIVGNKPHMVLLNKCDMADASETKRWIEYYNSQGIKALAIDCKSGKGVSKIFSCVKLVLGEKIKEWKQKGMDHKCIRMMIIGIPNVGKSTIINRLIPNAKTKAKAEDRPGVTRGNQWFTLDNGFEILDTPGILWPKFQDREVGLHLAFIGAIKDQVMDIEELAVELIKFLMSSYKEKFFTRFKLSDSEVDGLIEYDILKLIGKKRRMVMKGENVDTQRTSVMLLDEFRAAKIGNITIERVENNG